MAMGIVNSNDFDAELAKLNKTSPSATVIDSIRPGRKDGDVAVPESLKKIIGETSEIDGRKEAISLAKMFDISPSSVSAYAAGATSTASYDKPVSGLLSHINKSKERISKKARQRLNRALDSITDEKLEGCKPEVAATIARHMSAIVKDMEPDVASVGKDNGPTFIFYSPHMKKESDFDVIDAQSLEE